MLVFFLRHAEAVPDAENDFARALTPKGLDQAEKVGRYCLKLGLIPDVVLTSPVARAKQTAKIASEKMGGVDLTEEHWLACGMAPETCLRELRRFDKHGAVMLVGHEPDFSESIAAMIGLEEPDNLKVRKSSLTAVDLSELQRGCGVLQFSIPARLM
jgi:phosphohistidine phosphatase